MVLFLLPELGYMFLMGRFRFVGEPITLVLLRFSFQGILRDFGDFNRGGVGDRGGDGDDEVIKLSKPWDSSGRAAHFIVQPRELLLR